jgi:hypothetical protein
MASILERFRKRIIEGSQELRETAEASETQRRTEAEQRRTARDPDVMTTRAEPVVFEARTDQTERESVAELEEKRARQFTHGVGDDLFQRTRGKEGNITLTTGGKSITMTAKEFATFQAISEMRAGGTGQGFGTGVSSKLVQDTLKSKISSKNELEELNNQIRLELEAAGERTEYAPELELLAQIQEQFTPQEALDLLGFEFTTLSGGLTGVELVDVGAKGTGAALGAQAIGGTLLKSSATTTATATGALALAPAAIAYIGAVQKGQKLTVDEADRFRTITKESLGQLEADVAGGYPIAWAVDDLIDAERAMMASDMVLKMLEDDPVGAVFTDARNKRIEVKAVLAEIRRAKLSLEDQIIYPDVNKPAQRFEVL